ncbi:MAG TPA: hypothetical protein VJ987_04425 [Anaerolineales bacterium]|nr:hypothetical protein [Anaerolineales bacterium]
MTKKKSKNKNQNKPVESSTTSKSTRAMQVLFLILSAMIVLSMILAATSSF